MLVLKNAAVLTELMNGIAHYVRRPVEFVHIPIPKHADASFFAPLRDWQRPGTTQLYLGLLQFDDDAGNHARIDAARTVVNDFGVGAECGFGRTDPARIPRWLDGHRKAALVLQDGAR